MIPFVRYDTIFMNGYVGIGSGCSDVRFTAHQMDTYTTVLRCALLTSVNSIESHTRCCEI